MHVDYHDVLYVALAMLIGLIIGAEREYRNKPAGLRTLMLVSVGSCIFTILSLKIGIANPDRLAANIITGIGFLGAGAIFKDDNKINGLTTATTIWVSAALGMCIGSGNIFLALIGAVAVEIVLWLLKYVDLYIDNYNCTRDYKIVTHFTSSTLQAYEAMFVEHKLKFIRGTQERNKHTISGNWKLIGSKLQHEKLLSILIKDEKIHELYF